MCCTKLILFTTNAVIFVLGVAVVAIASTTINRGSEYGELLLEGIVTLPIVILILGLIVCTIGFLGCFGALKESRCMMYTYSGIVLILFIGEIAVAILLIAHPEATKNALEDLLNNQFAKYEGPDEVLTKSIDNMQKNLKCCGVDSFTDWNEFWDKKNTAPWSCCHEDSSDGDCPFFGSDSDQIHQKGCMDAVVEEFQDITLALGISGVVLAIFMFFSMTTACGIARRNHYK